MKSKATDNMAGGSMPALPEHRRVDIVDYLKTVGSASVVQLSRRFDVSEDTIRRDLDLLNKKGVILRTRGGAMIQRLRPRSDTGIRLRMALNRDLKEIIGQLAVDLVENDSSLFINSGSTSLAVARHLGGRQRLRIVTNNLALSSEVSESAVEGIHVLGGEVYMKAQGTVGPVVMYGRRTQEPINIHCDLGVFSVGGVSSAGVFSVGNVPEADMFREMMGNCERVAVVSDSSKFDKQMLAEICDCDTIDYFVSDSRPPTATLRTMKRHGVTVISPDQPAGKSS